MDIAETTGVTFVLGILGIGVTFVTIYFRNNASLCERVTKLETKIEDMYEMIQSLRKDRDVFHPRM